LRYLAYSSEEYRFYGKWLYQRALELCRLYFSAIETVAKALMLKKTLSRAEVSKIVVFDNRLDKLPTGQIASE
jgi:hypothetical protein